MLLESSLGVEVDADLLEPFLLKLSRHKDNLGGSLTTQVLSNPRVADLYWGRTTFYEQYIADFVRSGWVYASQFNDTCMFGEGLLTTLFTCIPRGRFDMVLNPGIVIFLKKHRECIDSTIVGRGKKRENNRATQRASG